MQRASQSNEDSRVTNLLHLSNSSKGILYTTKLKGGTLKLTADEAAIKAKTEIVLNNIKAVFKKQDNEVIVKSQHCKFNMKTKKVVLYNNVTIHSSNVDCVTEEAVIDLEKSSIFGKSKIEGKQSNIKFKADGFSVDSKGMVKLKNAEFGKI